MNKINKVADWEYVEHMLDQLDLALELLADDCNDRKSLNAMIRCFEVIGEAANNVSETVRNENQHIPWREMINTRNRFIHGYFDIIPSRVWEIAQDQFPALQGSLQTLHSQLKNQED